jgi:hypothetical protein
MPGGQRFSEFFRLRRVRTRGPLRRSLLAVPTRSSLRPGPRRRFVCPGLSLSNLQRPNSAERSSRGSGSPKAFQGGEIRRIFALSAAGEGSGDVLSMENSLWPPSRSRSARVREFGITSGRQVRKFRELLPPTSRGRNDRADRSTAARNSENVCPPGWFAFMATGSCSSRPKKFRESLPPSRWSRTSRQVKPSTASPSWHRKFRDCWPPM